MQTTQIIYSISFFYSIILAKPFYKDTNYNKHENAETSDEHFTTVKIKLINTVRRQDDSCDYLYEDCASEEFEIEKTVKIKNKTKSIKKLVHNLHEKMKIDETDIKTDNNQKYSKLEFKDSLEDLSNLDDIFNFDARPNDGKVDIRQNRGTTLSTAVWYYAGRPEKIPKLPAHIRLCNDESKCRMPFQTRTTYSTT